MKGEPVAESLAKGLRALQHRGQESWGIALHGEQILKGMGLVGNATEPNLRRFLKLHSSRGIGHVRYSTRGRTTIENAHPIDIEGAFTMAQNGTIANTEDFELLVAEEFGAIQSTTDTRLIGLRLLQHQRVEKDWNRAFGRLSKEASGSYCLVILTTNGELLAARDEAGFRPLCLGFDEESETHIIASESCAISALNGQFVRDIEPGELVRITQDGLTVTKFAKSAHHHCPFEYTYFAHPSSTIHGRNVYETRKQLGKILARKYPFDADVVIPVPDSARPAALGYSDESGIPLEEGLMKDRYRRKGSLRSFIEPTDTSREEVVKEMITIRSVVDGKDVVVVDDSIVRGTSSRNIVRALREAGAKRIYMVITFPPIRHACYMGIDFPTRKELLVNRLNESETLPTAEINERVAREIGVDGVGYNDLDALSMGIGLPEHELCHACITGVYEGLRKIPGIKTREEMKA
jgi:amidophosphoribosyltransferase